MAGNEYAIRFSEEKYLSKNEVAKEMRMSIIDTIWSNVLNYRSNYYKYLPIKSIDRQSLFICLCLNVSSKISDADKHIEHLLEEEKKLSTVNGDSQYFTLSSKLNALKAIKTFREYPFQDNDIKDLINGKKIPIDENQRHIFNYYQCLSFLEKNHSRVIDESYLADLYAVLTGQEELTYFYRVNEDNSSANRIVIDRLYHSAPVHAIEPMMNYLFEFINSFEIGCATKALIAYYYIDYIKPFASYNEEVAVLVAKAILSHSLCGNKGSLINFEDLINEKVNDQSKYNEVQKTQDITYFVVYGFDYITRKVQHAVDSIYDYSSTIMKEDFYKEETPVVETPTPKVEEKVITTEPKVEPKVEPAKPVEKPKIKEESKPVSVTPAAPTDLAVSFIPPELDEKTAQRLTTHLLECDPNLNKKEAYFYARHCTLGKIYTIQQYKKCVGCVYETARYGMEHLKELGYYQESMIKNKKVYTPVKR